MREKKVKEIMDNLEKAIILSVQMTFKSAGIEMTYNEIRNIVGKVGVGIIFGQEVITKALAQPPIKERTKE